MAVAPGTYRGSDEGRGGVERGGGGLRGGDVEKLLFL